MSHFTHIKTRFQNFFYLEKVLNRLDISHKVQVSSKTILTPNIVIPQSNSYNIQFTWTGSEYELVVDLSFWQQPYTTQSFIDKVAQYYAEEVIIGESQKIGFRPIKYKVNVDGSNTLILERWKIR